MYVYLYDQFLRDKKYVSALKAIEVRLTDHGIAGKIIRLNTHTDAKAIIEEEIKRGAKTVVIEAGTNLSKWSPIFTNLSPSNSFDFIDPQASNFPRRFYRAVK